MCATQRGIVCFFAHAYLQTWFATLQLHNDKQGILAGPAPEWGGLAFHVVSCRAQNDPHVVPVWAPNNSQPTPWIRQCDCEFGCESPDRVSSVWLKHVFPYVRIYSIVRRKHGRVAACLLELFLQRENDTSRAQTIEEQWRFKEDVIFGIVQRD